MKLKIFFIFNALVLFFLVHIPAEIFFNGYIGAKVDIAKVETDESASKSEQEAQEREDGLGIQTFFTGQLNLSKSLMLRGEFSIQSDDIFDTGLFNYTEAIFCINELSATYVKPFLGNTQYISGFFGTFEPIGSDVFLQRQFGMKPITSLLTESWLGLRGSYIYPFYGAGASYILHLDSWPIAKCV